MSLAAALDALFDCSIKLETKSETYASAAVFFHRFFKECSPSLYDPHLIAATCVYLAGKVEEDHVKVRDVVNVFYATLNKEGVYKPLDLNDDYWNLRDSIIQCELLVLRILQFKVSYEHPHKYLNYYLKALTRWIGEDEPKTELFQKTCWSLLNDFYLNPNCLDFKSNHTAIAIIQIALECNQIKVPYNEEALLEWQEVFCEDISKSGICTIVNEILSCYDKQADGISQIVNMDISPQPGHGSFSRQYAPQKVIEYHPQKQS